MKKWIAVLLSVLLLFSLTACGAKSETVAEEVAVSTQNLSASDAATAEGGWAEPEEMAEEEIADEAAAAVESPTETSAETIAEKIIYSANLALETTKFDASIAAVEAMIGEFGGYIQSSSVNGDTMYNEDGSTTIVNRYAYYTIAVPSEKFESFLGKTGDIGNVTYLNRSAENVTSQYTDTEARLDSLRVQEERLMAMMEQTGDLESLIALEQRLSDVTYEIESYQRNLNNLDRRIAYSTITLEMWEVEIYTPTVPVTRTFGEKLSDAFADGWNGFVRGGQRFILFLAEALPTLILLAVIATGVIVIIRTVRKRGEAKRTAKAAEKAAKCEKKSEEIRKDNSTET